MTAREALELYRKAVQSIALNDDPSELSVENVRGSVSVGIVADVFGYTTEQVARAVVRARRKSEPRAECRGHESTEGPIGNVVYCDGTCRARRVS